MSHHCKVIPMVNQKGGVGKSTTAVNLATALSAIGNETLIIDLDPQGNASSSFGIGHSIEELGRNDLYGWLTNQSKYKDVIKRTSIPKLSIMPTTMDLAAIEIELSTVQDREFILSEKIKSISDKYKYIIIDCPPSLGLLTINALVAADSVIIPLQAEFFALEGLASLLKTIALIRKALNDKLRIEGIVLTMFDRRNRLSTSVEKEAREMFQDLVYNTVIPRNVKLSEAPSFGKPALIYDHRCLGSQAYIKLAKEVAEKLNLEMRGTA